MDNIEETKIIDYIYGNLPETERNAMEKSIDENNILKNEIESFTHLQNVMSNLEDKEVIPPSFVFEAKSSNIIPFFQTTFFKRTMAIAAGLTLLLLSSYLTGLEMNYNNKGLNFGFNTSDSKSSNDEMRAMIQEVLAENQNQTDRKIMAIESKLTQKVDNSNVLNLDSMQKLLASNSNNSKDIMRTYVKQINQENLELIQNFFLVSTEQQQQYLKTVLTDFNDFYQSQRNNDLQMIKTGFEDLQNNNEVKQYETDVVLANLIDIVQVKNK